MNIRLETPQDYREVENLTHMAYPINGNMLKLLDDNATYWDTQVEKGDGRYYGIACDEHYILVSEYVKNGTSSPAFCFFFSPITL